MTIIEKLAALRELMKQHQLDAYIVPANDPHASEYMAEHWMETAWLTGFQGESATIVVTMDEALLFTDSRYYLQAEEELKGTTIQLMRASDVDCPTVNEWLVKKFSEFNGFSEFRTKPAQPAKPAQPTVGVNPEMWSINEFSEFSRFSEFKVVSIDLIRELWTEDRPAIPQNPLYEYKEEYAGESVASKLQRVREAIKAKGADAIVISELDEIGWLLNVRGTDVDYTPCVIAYVVVEQARCTLFIDPAKMTAEAKAYMQRIGVEVKEYEEVFDFLKTATPKRFMMDGNRVNQRLYEAVESPHQASPRKGGCIIVSPSPVQVMMSIKNEVEIAGERKAHLIDGVALVRFLKWLEEPAKPFTEIDLADKLHEFRAMGEHFTDESFATIAGWKGNGAIVHYHAEPNECAKIEGEGVLLLDSGGQYLDGTTDITRTLWIGDAKHIPAEVKHDYTLVLKGHIALAKARFPKGTRGNQLDVLAHQYMWAESITYGHGTGHGVGHFMGCHEGPANIRTDNNTNPIQLGNIFSDEPGIYRTNEYGIRIENLVVTKLVESGEWNMDCKKRSTGETYYEFEVLTRCPYDKNLMELSMLTAEEKEWINAYHALVYKDLAPMLNKEEAQWLKEQCRALC